MLYDGPGTRPQATMRADRRGRVDLKVGTQGRDDRVKGDCLCRATMGIEGRENEEGWSRCGQDTGGVCRTWCQRETVIRREARTHNVTNGALARGMR